jgi:hypothetical protein
MRNLRASQHDRVARRRKSPARRGHVRCYVGCLTARRRNDPKQAGLSIQCPSDRTVRLNARSLPLPSGMGIDDESDQVT